MKGVTIIIEISTNIQDNQHLTPADVKEVKLNELKKKPNVPIHEENEFITVVKVVNTASSQFCTEFVK